MFFPFGDSLFRNPIKAIFDFLLKAVWEFIKKRAAAMVWGWVIWTVCVGFVLVVGVCLLLWYLVGR